MAKWVTVKATAAAAGKRERMVRRWVADGKIRYKRAGRRVLKDVSKLPNVHDSDTTNVIDSGVTDDTVSIARLEAELKGMTREVTKNRCSWPTENLNTGRGKPAEPTPIINQVIEFADGSRIKVIVEALKDRHFNQATDAYYNMLVPVLDEMEFPDD